MLYKFFFFTPLILILSACIDITSFDINYFDIFFTPAILIFVFYKIILSNKIKKPLNIYIIICSIIFIFSFIANFNSKEIILDIGLTIRSLLIFIMTFIYFSLITKVLQQKHNKEIYLLKIILFTGSTLVIMSTVQLVIFGLPRFNYPFTLEGADPHVYGLSLATLGITSLYLLTNNLLKKLSSIEIFSIIFQFILIFFGTLNTGSRGVFLYGGIALLPKIFIFLFSIFNSLKINKKLFIISSSLLLFAFITISLVSDIRGLNFFENLNRVFNIYALIVGEDVSRSQALTYYFNYIIEFQNYTLLGLPYKEPVVDVGIVFYLMNFGILGLISFYISFLSIGFPQFFMLKNYTRTSLATKFHILGLVAYNTLSSESIVIPRCTLIVSFTTAILLFRDYSKSNTKNYLIYD